jgi:transcriptional regulator with XRE-family HTH domain
MSDDPTTPGAQVGPGGPVSGAEVKARRKALGWNRAELADRAGVDRAALALVERDAWSEEDALRRVAEVLWRAEHGEPDVRLAHPEAPKDCFRM